MDEASRLETYTQWLRVRYSDDLVGLKKLIRELGDGEASDSVVINSHGFVDGSAAGQIVLEPLLKLKAAMTVLAELDPTATPMERPNYAYFRFSAGTSTT